MSSNNPNHRQTSLQLLKPAFRKEIERLLNDLHTTPETKCMQVFETLRTEARQQMLRRRGVSRIRHSHHQDGLACDIVPKINGRWTWSGKQATAAFYKMREIIRKLYPALKILGSWDLAHVEWRS